MSMEILKLCSVLETWYWIISMGKYQDLYTRIEFCNMCEYIYLYYDNYLYYEGEYVVVEFNHLDKFILYLAFFNVFSVYFYGFLMFNRKNEYI